MAHNSDIFALAIRSEAEEDILDDQMRRSRRVGDVAAFVPVTWGLVADAILASITRQGDIEARITVNWHSTTNWSGLFDVFMDVYCLASLPFDPCIG